MKRTLLVAAISFFAVLGASAQHYNHWSFMGYVGAAGERGNLKDVFKRVIPSFSLRGEYAVSPMFSFGLEGNYMPYNRNDHYKPTDIWSTYAYGSLNLTNAFMGVCEKFSLSLNAGMGPSWGGSWGFSKAHSNITLSGFVGLGAEWNMSKHFALGLEGRIRPFSSLRYRGTEVSGKDHLNNYVPNSVPAFYEAGLTLRYKLTPWKREGDHMRNTDMTKLRRF